MRVAAVTKNWEAVGGYIEDTLKQMGCPLKEIFRIMTAAEEVFVNIASYAYPDGAGEAEVEIIGAEEKKITLTFSDCGIPYNPLKHKDPDITLSAQEREIGGLGIYIVKKNMDEVSYEYVDGKNVLTMSKKIDI